MKTFKKTLAVLLSAIMLLSMCGVAFAETCAHERIYHGEADNDPICGRPGNIEYWECLDCYQYFADAELTQPITYEEAYCIQPAYAEHDLTNELGLGYSEENEWVYYPAYLDTMYQQEYGKTLAEVYAEEGDTFWHCSHCGYLVRYEYEYDEQIHYSYSRLSEPFEVYPAGEQPVDPLAEYGDPLPIADSDELAYGDYYFDLASFITMMTGGEATEEEFEEAFTQYAQMYTFYLSEDGETLLLAYAGGASVMECTRDNEGSMYFMFLQQHGVEPADQLEGFSLVYYDIADIPYGGWLFLIDDYLADYAASMVGKTNSETNEPYTEDEIAAEIADIREEILHTSIYVNKAENKFAIKYSFSPVPMIFDLDDEEMAEITAYLTEYDPFTVIVHLDTEGLAAGDYWLDVVDYYGEEGDEEEIAAFRARYTISALPELAAIKLTYTESFVDDETSEPRVESFDIILTPDGEYAEDYAEWVQYIYLTFAANKESTCKVAGYENAVAIEKDGETVVLVEGTPLQLAAHTPKAAVKEHETAATCTAAGGYEEVVYCEVCGDEISRTQKTIDATGHTWGGWAVTTPATATEKGVETRECSVCHAKETRDIAPTGTGDNGGNNGGNTDSGDNRCKWCGEEHNGFWGSIVGFFHRILYFFAHLFGRR